MLADGFLTAGILSLVMPLALLALVFAAWWVAVKRRGLGESAPEQRDSAGGRDSPGA